MSSRRCVAAAAILVLLLGEIQALNFQCSDRTGVFRSRSQRHGVRFQVGVRGCSRAAPRHPVGQSLSSTAFATAARFREAPSTSASAHAIGIIAEAISEFDLVKVYRIAVHVSAAGRSQQLVWGALWLNRVTSEMKWILSTS